MFHPARSFSTHPRATSDTRGPQLDLDPSNLSAFRDATLFNSLDGHGGIVLPRRQSVAMCRVPDLIALFAGLCCDWGLCRPLNLLFFELERPQYVPSNLEPKQASLRVVSQLVPRSLAANLLPLRPQLRPVFSARNCPHWPAISRQGCASRPTILSKRHLRYVVDSLGILANSSINISRLSSPDIALHELIERPKEP